MVNVRRIVPDLVCEDPERTGGFYTALLGLRVAMDLGWVITLVSPANPTAQLILQRRPPSSPRPPAPGSAGPTELMPGVSIEVDDVDAVHATAIAMGVEIAYALRDEPWGVRRFFVVDPDGLLVNVVGHRPAT